jgi:hypothetical protein
MTFLTSLYAFLVAHKTAIAEGALVVLPTIITGLSAYPKDAGLVSFLKGVLSLLSFLTHKDSPGTFKLPLTSPTAPSTTAQGFIRFPVLLGLALAALALAAAPAYAQTPTTTEATPQRLVGGCNAKGSICAGPSVVLAMTAYDITHKHVIGSFSPGVGYGVTFLPNRWDSFGFDFYLSMQTGPQEGITFAGMAKFANGYIRVGIARQILTGGPTSTFIPAGIGLDF